MPVVFKDLIYYRVVQNSEEVVGVVGCKILLRKKGDQENQ